MPSPGRTIPIQLIASRSVFASDLAFVTTFCSYKFDCHTSQYILHHLRAKIYASGLLTGNTACEYLPQSSVPLASILVVSTPKLFERNGPQKHRQPPILPIDNRLLGSVFLEASCPSATPPATSQNHTLLSNIQLEATQPDTCNFLSTPRCSIQQASELSHPSSADAKRFQQSLP